MNYTKFKKLPFLLACVHFAISFFTDRLFFEYSLSDSTFYNIQLFLIKGGFFFVLWAMYAWISFVLGGIRSGVVPKEKILYLLVYLLLNLVILILVWPGMWVDMSILEPAKYMRLQTWHHVVSSLVDIYSAMLLPFSAGVIIVQVVLISVIAAHTTVEVNRLIHGKAWMGAVIFTAFLSPALLLYNQNNFRAVLYSYISLYFAIAFYQFLNSPHLRRRQFIPLVLSGVLTCVWRSEGVVWLGIIVIVTIMLITTKKLPAKAALFPFAVLLGFLLVWKVNGYYEQFSTENYTLVATLRQADALVLAADPVEDLETLEKIDKCINVDLMRGNPEHDGNWFFWYRRQEFVRDFTEDDLKEYAVSLVKLAFKYPCPLIQERVSMFTGAVGIHTERQKSIVDDTMRFEVDDAHKAAQDILTESIGGLFTWPINKDLRSDVINFLGGRDENGDITWRSYLCVTACDGLIAVFLALFIGIALRNRGVIIVNTAVILQGIVVFLTEPDPNFFYYLPLEAIGRVELFGMLALLIQTCIERHKSSVNCAERSDTQMRRGV